MRFWKVWVQHARDYHRYGLVYEGLFWSGFTLTLYVGKSTLLWGCYKL